MYDPWFQHKLPDFSGLCSCYTPTYTEKKSGDFQSVIRIIQEGDLGQEAREGNRIRLVCSGLQSTKCCVYLSHSVINHPEIWPKHLFRLEVAHTVSHYKLNITEFRAGNHTSPWRNNSPKFLLRTDF